MALSKGSTTLASDFIALKARIKAECARRKYNGSVEKYASSAYDYTVTPVAGNHPLPEHYNKIIVPFNNLSGSNLPTKNVGNVVPYLSTVSSQLAVLESYQPTDGSSGCKSSCTGLCQGTCTTGCTGCTGDCTGTCSNTCTGSCSNSCTGTCGGSCSGSCTNSCSGACGDACSQSCTSSCYTLCTGGCKGNCEGSCGGGCTSCTGGCAGYCTASGGVHPAD